MFVPPQMAWTRLCTWTGFASRPVGAQVAVLLMTSTARPIVLTLVAAVAPIHVAVAQGKGGGGAGGAWTGFGGDSVLGQPATT